MGADTGGRASYLKTSLPMALGSHIERDSMFGDQSIRMSGHLPAFLCSSDVAAHPTLMNHLSPGLGAPTPKSEYGNTAIERHLPPSRRLSVFHPFPFQTTSGFP